MKDDATLLNIYTDAHNQAEELYESTLADHGLNQSSPYRDYPEEVRKAYHAWLEAGSRLHDAWRLTYGL